MCCFIRAVWASQGIQLHGEFDWSVLEKNATSGLDYCATPALPGVISRATLLGSRNESGADAVDGDGASNVVRSMWPNTTSGGGRCATSVDDDGCESTIHLPGVNVGGGGAPTNATAPTPPQHANHTTHTHTTRTANHTHARASASDDDGA